MDQIIIRKATINDMDALLQFEQGVIAAERPFDSTLQNDPVRYYDLDTLITANHIELLVAEENGQVIGSGYARIENSKHYLQHKQHAYLGFMYTDPQHRGKGVNQKIIAVLKKWSAEKQVFELRLEVYLHNLAAIKAYEKAGFSRHMLEMRMRIQ
jgi:ribosomal protein S18 acetylase RimI-like enzyme